MKTDFPDISLAGRYAALTGLIKSTVCAYPLASHPGARLVGASKSQPAERIADVIALGLRDFGENKVQEAAQKWTALKQAHPEVRLHLIGPLQSNKAEEAAALFDVIQTVDRAKLADALAAAFAKLEAKDNTIPPPLRGRLGGGSVELDAVSVNDPPSHPSPARGEGVFKRPRLLIQVNIGEEPQKSGVAPQETKALLEYCRSKGLVIDGLMCVPPADVNPAPYFALLTKMAKEFGLSELSMGMSSDAEPALRLGATMVRIGTALFGERAA